MAKPPSTKPSRHSRKSSTLSTSSRTSTAQPKTEVIINVYDLLPPGRLSSILWTIGGSLLHSGVVINGREYAYGGHNKKNVTGVYWTSPRFEPPGGTFRADILQGFTFQNEEEIERIVKEVSDSFLGPSYNLLQHNCNHFTSALCVALTSKPAPSWLNRAASIGLAMPCVVPKEWIAPPDHETADGELLDDVDDDDDEDDEDEFADENAGLVESDRKRQLREEERLRAEGSSLAGGRRIQAKENEPPARVVNLKTRDSEGRELPVAERAPLPAAWNS
ncbi:uncharacterized protein RCC_08410 [Ramularia collo-cygni]|uniref:PPPDE domain-containing protein n=1 Tax=Ramularia collo-cygni TaxID=112498 RepID=A0A2D3VAP5_9PEZI|nr:uncharacterized protein RCC_08410 [Ramularia collo-cygni]CZT22705.1 uncharacterized protein RCC_08410 [Ramularia collo-cygni]